MPTITFSLLLLASAIALAYGLVGSSGVVLKKRAAARTRHLRDQQLLAEAAAEVRNV